MRDDDHLRKVCEVVITNCGGSVCLLMTLSRSVLHFLQYKKFCEIVMAVKCNEFGLSSEAAKGYLVGSV